MRVLVCGGREFDDWPLFCKTMDKLFEVNGLNNQSVFETREIPIYIIHGNAIGADFLARVWCNLWGFKELRYPADWRKHGKAAGAIRNQQMLDEGQPDIVVAFPGGTGTADMVRRAKKIGVEVLEIKHDT